MGWRPVHGLRTAAHGVVRPVHDRMSVIVEPRHYDLWIDRDVQEPVKLADVLRPYAANRMRAYAVSPLMNSPRNEDACCLEPAA